MDDMKSANPLRWKAVDPLRMRPMDWIIRSLLAVDVALLILTIIPASSGMDPMPWLVDRLWGKERYGGFRADVVWMCVSTIVILVGGLRPTIEPGAERTTSNLCWGWLGCFFAYLCYIVTHMF